MNKSKFTRRYILNSTRSKTFAAFFLVISLHVANELDHGAIIRGNTTKKQIALVFTADEFADGGKIILSTLQKQKIKASFFFTGRFYRNPKFQPLIRQAKQQGHYLGPHSDQHLLYCDWAKRDSLLITKK